MTDEALLPASPPSAPAPPQGWRQRLREDPNPIWIRELKQSARLVRTPAILAVLTVVLTLIIAAIGGVMSYDESPSKVGSAIFHTYFSLAYAVVTLVGPAVAANSIASEREGRTWEAVVLTGLPADVIARGKFLAALTGVGTYIVALAPVAALAFLFGGVTATQVVVAFVLLALIAVLCIAFGLAISSALSNLRIALVLTLLLAVVCSVMAYSTVGVGGSVLAHELWPTVTEGAPVWLPIAYDRASFGLAYVVLLIATPLVALGVPAWFFYEVTVANLSSLNADRSWRLKRWFVVCAPLVTAWGLLFTGLLVARSSGSDQLLIVGAAVFMLAAFFLACAFLFQSEPLGPSRRVKADYVREGASAVRRFLGPSAVNGAALVLFVGAALLAVSAVGWLVMLTTPSLGGSTTSAVSPYLGVLILGGYAVATHVFMSGAAAYIRVRVRSLAAARFVLAGLAFVVAAVPWMVGGITGALSLGMASSTFAIAAPSPFYAFALLDALRRASTPVTLYTAGAASVLAYGLLGLVLLGLARRRSNAVIAEHDKAVAEAESRLAEEDAAMYAEQGDEDEVEGDEQGPIEPDEAPGEEPTPPGEPA